MSFAKGFEKIAKSKGELLADVGKKVTKALIGGKQMAGGVGKGLKAVKDTTVGAAFDPRNIPSHFKGLGLDSLKSKAGRAALGEAVGKSLPGAATVAGGAYAGKKLYDATLGSPDSKSQEQYMINNYGQ